MSIEKYLQLWKSEEIAPYLLFYLENPDAECLKEFTRNDIAILFDVKNWNYVLLVIEQIRAEF